MGSAPQAPLPSRSTLQDSAARWRRNNRGQQYQPSWHISSVSPVLLLGYSFFAGLRSSLHFSRSLLFPGQIHHCFAHSIVLDPVRSLSLLHPRNTISNGSSAISGHACRTSHHRAHHLIVPITSDHYLPCAFPDNDEVHRVNVDELSCWL